MRIRTLLVAALCAAAAPSAGAGPITQDPCGGSASVALWRRLGSNVLENLLFAEGTLYVSDATDGAVVRLDDASSAPQVVLEGASPGGLAQGADGLIYAGLGNSLANSFTRNGQGKVVRFDPDAPAGTLTTVVSGIDMPNGMTFLPDGDLAVSNDGGYGLLRIDVADGSFSELAHVWGTNGIVVVGDALYAAITFDQRSPIARVPFDGGPVSHEIQLTYGAASLQPAVYEPGADPAEAPLLGVKGLDDMTRDADALYVVANGMGELLRVDPATGDACLIASGLQNPSSVRIAPEPGPYADGDPATLDLYVTEFSGAIRVVRFDPA